MPLSYTLWAFSLLLPAESSATRSDQGWRLVRHPGHWPSDRRGCGGGRGVVQVASQTQEGEEAQGTQGAQAQEGEKEEREEGERRRADQGNEELLLGFCYFYFFASKCLFFEYSSIISLARYPNGVSIVEAVQCMGIFLFSRSVVRDSYSTKHSYPNKNASYSLVTCLPLCALSIY